MIELQDDQCIRIGDTFAIVGTVEGMAALTGMEPKEKEEEYRKRPIQRSTRYRGGVARSGGMGSLMLQIAVQTSTTSSGARTVCRLI